MKIVKTPRITATTLRALILGVPAALALGGCAVTGQNFAQTGDTRQAWGERVAQLPVVLEGALPQRYRNQFAAYQPNGIATDAPIIDATYVPTLNAIPHATRDRANLLLQKRRVVLMIDAEQAPAAVDTCAVIPQQLHAGAVDGPLQLRAALCDGTRTVDVLEARLPQQDLTQLDTGRRVAELEQRLVDQLPAARGTLYGEPVADQPLDQGPTLTFPGG